MKKLHKLHSVTSRLQIFEVPLTPQYRALKLKLQKLHIKIHKQKKNKKKPHNIGLLYFLN